MSRTVTKLIRESEYLGEVDVEMTDTPEGWGPYLSLNDARKLDSVRAALRRGDVQEAQRLARVWRVMPLVDASS